jgi:ornithine cyclodeaminase/alanine dehydrogenase-like protein (mu-crystallin family)
MATENYIDEEQVRALLSYDELIPTIRQALMDFSAGRAQHPVRTIIQVPSYGGWFGIMPAVYGTVMGAKMVAFYPGNAALERHTHMAVIQLFRADTGEPLATMDGRLITEMRTAAVSAVAIQHMAILRRKSWRSWAVAYRPALTSERCRAYANSKRSASGAALRNTPSDLRERLEPA